MSAANSTLIEQFAQQLAGNASLRNQLEPDQGDQLLNWGLKQFRQVAAGADEAQLGDIADAISRLLRQVNGLSPMLAFLIEDEMAEDLALAFVGTVKEITGHTLADDWIDEIVNNRGDRDEAATFNHLMNSLESLAGK